MNELAHKRTERTWIEVSSARLDVAAAADFLRTERAGGIDIFLGTTRRWTLGRETAELEYECYTSMALQEMDRLIEEAGEQWALERACLIHRTGIVPVREISVIVGAATAHRADAFAACRFLIDALKVRVPIWKRERYTDGTQEWVQGSVSRSVPARP